MCTLQSFSTVLSCIFPRRETGRTALNDRFPKESPSSKLPARGSCVRVDRAAGGGVPLPWGEPTHWGVLPRTTRTYPRRPRQYIIFCCFAFLSGPADVFSFFSYTDLFLIIIIIIFSILFYSSSTRLADDRLFKTESLGTRAQLDFSGLKETLVYLREHVCF